MKPFATKSLFMLAVLLTALQQSWADPLLTYPLSIGPHRLRVEVANTGQLRQNGLMHRQSLAENHGMVFVFERAGPWAMWMKNTPIPLSVAFLSEDGRILNIEDMQPHTEQSHAARGQAKYAIEMNLSWFKKRKIKPGQRVMGLAKLPPAQ